MGLGINCARKLRLNRRANLNNAGSPFKKIPHERKAMVLGFYTSEAKQPCSGDRNYVRINLNGAKSLAFIKGDGIKNFLKIHDTVLIQSVGGTKGRAMGDLSGCRYAITKINGVAVKELFLRKKSL